MMQKSISEKPLKVRESNFELLRIIAMLMVLILHADFISLGAPDKSEIMVHPWESAIKVFVEVTCIVAVNIFVLISGWFGIRISLRGFLKFVFQVLFFSLGIFMVLLMLGKIDFSVRILASCFALVSYGGSYWFIPAYLCLYVISPVLNAFIEYSDQRLTRTVLLSFFLFQTIYSFLGNGTRFLSCGYSTLSFAGLYILAAYYKKYYDLNQVSKRALLIGYLVITMLQTLMYVFFSYKSIDGLCSRITYYSNPLVILSSVSLFLLFSKIRFTNRFINWMSESCFAVYLLHSSPILFCSYYIPSIATATDYGSILCIVVFWFIAAILIDQLRKVAWRGFCLFLK